MRQERIAILIPIAVLTGIPLLGCTTSGPNREHGRASGRHTVQTPASQSTVPHLGYLEHRERKYALRDLMDPAYRLATDDDFARRFDPDMSFAREPVLDASGPARAPSEGR